MAYEGSKLDYNASVSSQHLNEEAKLSISEEGLALTTLFNPFFISFADIVSFELQNFTILLKTEDDCFTFSRLGNYCEPFYLELYEAFNHKVRDALFIKGDPDFSIEGEFRFLEGDLEVQGHGQIQVYDDCVCLLPPNNQGRRIPFAFLNGLQKGDFELTLSLSSGEHYNFLRLGNNSLIFETCIKEKLHSFRKNSIDAVRNLDSSLNPTQLNSIAAQMPQGVAVSMGELQTIAPSYVDALEGKINGSRAAETYAAFKEICNPPEISIGMKSCLAGEEEEHILWFIATSPHKPIAAVELALSEETAAATFVYHIGDDRKSFILRLNQAMEAIDFKREVISMEEDQLKSAENSRYYMAVKRTSALRFMRTSFAGRIIHSSLDTWKKEMLHQFC